MFCIHTNHRDTIGIKDLSFEERGTHHIKLTLDDAKKIIDDIFGPTKEGIIAHEHGADDNLCHF